MIHAHPLWRSANFSFSIHGIRRVRPCYNLHCVAKNCKEKFTTVKAWNGHYHLCHHILLKCSTCSKSFCTPNSYRDHKYSHQERKYTCTVCDKCFVFKSGAQIHCCVHLKQKLFKCFAGSCTASYKWHQDLHCHIQGHLSVVHRCKLCKYSMSEKCMIHQHQVVHSPHYKYYCTKNPECLFRSKYYTSNAHHQYRCKFQ